MKLTFRIQKTTDFIFEYLTDMQKFVSVHPVITQIDKTGNDSYLVHETLNFGFIPFSFTYRISIEKNQFNQIIIIRGIVMKLTKIEMKFVLKQDMDFTLVEESIQIKSLLPVKSMMESIFRKQHHQLFKNIELL
jgi:carbon monoxide dehydrogenase subunit G